VVVKKWGPSRSSFAFSRKLAGHWSSPRMGFHTAHPRATVDALHSRSQTHSWHKATRSNTARAKRKHAGRELQGKVITATAYGCSLAS